MFSFNQQLVQPWGGFKNMLNDPDLKSEKVAPETSSWH